MIAADTSTWIAFLEGETAPDTELLDQALGDRQLVMIPVVLNHRNHYAVPSSDIMEQKVAIWMKCLVPERRRHCKFSAIDLCSGSRGGESRNMTSVAADLVEELRALFRLGRIRELPVPCWSFRGSDEAGETIDVRESIRADLIVRFLGRVAKVRHFVWK